MEGVGTTTGGLGLPLFVFPGRFCYAHQSMPGPSSPPSRVMAALSLASGVSYGEI
jgi:hypothetical protein